MTPSGHFTFSSSSLDKLATCSPLLRDVMFEAIKLTPIDFKVLWGHRGEAEQNRAYATGQSKLPWPKSKHNILPSLAIDIVPVPVRWEDVKRFCVVAGVVYSAALLVGVDLRWGGDWNRDGYTADGWDWGHFELVTGPVRGES